jgi:hypothetical protein
MYKGALIRFSPRSQLGRIGRESKGDRQLFDNSGLSPLAFKLQSCSTHFAVEMNKTL